MSKFKDHRVMVIDAGTTTCVAPSPLFSLESDIFLHAGLRKSATAI